MKISRLQHGNPTTIKITIESNMLLKSADVEKEVRLVFPETTDETLLFVGQDKGLAIYPEGDQARRRLSFLRRTDPPRLCWIAAINGSVVAINIHEFRVGPFWPETVSFGVDELAVERVCKLANRKMDTTEACRWLSEKVFLPPSTKDTFPRAIATGSPGTDSRFRLLGNRVRVDIVPREDTLRVEGVGRLNGKAQGFHPPEFLMEADMKFEDATVAGKMRRTISAQITQIVKETNSYLALWMKYQDLERDSIVRRARELGWLTYQTFEIRPNGLWRFTVPHLKALQEFRSKLGDWENLTLEAERNPPPELIGESAPSEASENPIRFRTAVGTLEDIHFENRELLLRPLDDDSDILPPKRGVLFSALHGDRSRLSRRENAVKRIQSADARLPQLGLIIEGRPAPAQRRAKVPAFTPKIRSIFDHEPTPAQRQAIHIALNTPDIAVIQGPPGTGKTKVITAIQAGLADLASDNPGVGGRTLLTSFQHDAVDNAADKTRVYGLPPMRFGGRRGTTTTEDRLQRWALDTREYIQAKLSEMPEERPLREYRKYRDRVAGYAAGIYSEEEARALVNDLVDLPVGTLPTPLWERLRALRRPAGAVPHNGDSLDHELMLKCAKGLRTTQTAFADDGPRKAHQALRRLTPLLSDEDRNLLEAAADVSPGGSFDRLEDLERMKAVLLDRLIPAEVPGERRRTDPDTLSALNAAVEALHTRLQGSFGSVPDVLAEYAEALSNDPVGTARMLKQYAAVYASTCQQSVGYHMIDAKGGEIGSTEFDNIIVDEAARANPLDLFIPMSLAGRRIILVGDQRQLPHLLEPDVERVLSQSADAASRKAMRESLFQKLFDELQGQENRDGIPRVITLDSQFRMHPTLGQFVSDVFYRDEGGFKSPRPAEEFRHQLPGYLRGNHPVCAAWKDIPLNKGREHSGRSKSRPAEARWIAGEVHRLLNGLDTGLSIGVITFYRAQVDCLLKALEDKGIAGINPDTEALDILPRFRTLVREDGGREERLRVGTVDAFQGKEFDVVFLSVTRANDFKTDTELDIIRKFGHLRLPNRLCVAMSRQKRLLVAVGDRAMFTSASGREEVPGLYRFIELCGGNDGLYT